jgi:hypothetical protein
MDKDLTDGLLGFALIVAVLMGCASAQSTQKTTITNDSYSSRAKVTTSSYHRESGSDVLLRTYVPKDGSSPTYQIYFQMIAQENWQFWDLAKYKAGGEVYSLQLNRVSSEPNCTSGTCFMHEDVLAQVERPTLEQIASSRTDTLRVYSGEVSGKWDAVTLPAAEINAMLSDVDSLSSKFASE